MWADEDDPDDFGAVIIALKQVRIYEAQGVRTYTVRKVDCSSLKATKERVFKTEKILGVLSAVGDKTQNKVQDTNAIPNTPG